MTGNASEGVAAGPQRVARETARRGGDAAWLEPAVRFGMLVYGVVHLVVALLALQLALGERRSQTDSTGALSALASQPFGRLVIGAVAVGMALLVLWRLLDAVAGHPGEQGAELWRHRLVDLSTAGIYGFLAFSAAKVATGSASGGSSSDALTARLMNLPAGQGLVGLVGVAVLAYAGALGWRGLSRSFADSLDSQGRRGDSGRAYLALGTAGYLAKGIALGIVGVLFVYAAATHRPKQSGGLDQALHELVRQPFGPWLLGVVAVGIGCYGLFCFAVARHLSR